MDDNDQESNTTYGQTAAIDSVTNFLNEDASLMSDYVKTFVDKEKVWIYIFMTRRIFAEAKILIIVC